VTGVIGGHVVGGAVVGEDEFGERTALCLRAFTSSAPMAREPNDDNPRAVLADQVSSGGPEIRTGAARWIASMASVWASNAQ
jgi:hypothetical protein